MTILDDLLWWSQPSGLAAKLSKAILIISVHSEPVSLASSTPEPAIPPVYNLFNNKDRLYKIAYLTADATDRARKVTELIPND